MKYVKNLEVVFESQEEMDYLVSLCIEMVTKGRISEPLRTFFEEWRLANSLDDRQGLLMMSTVFPLRIFISALKSPWKPNL